MKILVTGANGFVGKNLVAAFHAVMDGKDRTRGVTIEAVYEADIDTDRETLKDYCAKADFVFHLAGINRPQTTEEFMQGNRDAAADVLELLKASGNTCPVMLSSSLQATLKGRFGDSEYGRSKKAGEDLLFAYARETGAKVFVYRFPNLFGKWCRPNYNSAVATFCHNIANDLPIQVNDPNTELELLYIDDLVNEMFAASARAHIAEAGLQDAISVRVCDGLVGIVPDEVSDIVIAGMGGETMIHILSEAPWVCDARLRLVLQPMTKTVELRQWLYEHGFDILEEHLVLDGRHVYCVMAVGFDGNLGRPSALAPYIGALDVDEGQPYFRRQCTYLEKRIGGLRAAGNRSEAASLQAVLEALQTYIKDGSYETAGSDE